MSLKPCPFCGAIKLVDIDIEYGGVMCRKCGSCSPWCPTEPDDLRDEPKLDPATEWNRRPIEDALADALLAAQDWISNSQDGFYFGDQSLTKKDVISKARAALAKADGKGTQDAPECTGL